MPRKRNTPKKVTPAAVFTGHTLEDAAEMMTLDADHVIWSDTAQGAPNVEDHFVRLQPPMGVTVQEVAKMKAHLLDECGAAAVKVLPVQVTVVAEATELEDDEVQPERPIRQVVLERAARTPGVRCQDALEELLTQCMDKAKI